jgi:hypothetical protein
MTTRDRFELIMKFLHFADNTNKANYGGSTTLYKISLGLSHLDNFKNFFLQLTKSLH